MTDYDYIVAVHEWLGANTEYSLDAPVPPPGADAVDHFCFARCAVAHLTPSPQTMPAPLLDGPYVRRNP